MNNQIEIYNTIYALPKKVINRNNRTIKITKNNSLSAFYNILLNNINDDNLTILRKNINNVKIIKDSKITAYDIINNTIYLANDSLKDLHLCLLQVASSTFTNDVIYSGFLQIKPKLESYIGLSLNKAYTQLLLKRYFIKDNDNITPDEQICLMIEEMIGKEKVENFYFNADLLGLIEELKKYNLSEDEIYEFLYNFDEVEKGYEIYNDNKDKITEDEFKEYLINIYKDLYKFINNCQINKIENKVNLIKNS